ncbi:branched-chain amino acid ABC transporter ATP-binding protein/permease [Arthrobacter mobilis]|uniref:Branched-chain amino acid ABC transporter ATP-binding protein/permease n=1 Tax=Arthrobacter mobilis TaxID=2724944 RepID=A0A7X6K351_9MICC|nr:ATP-binding cassette domain-containing protein [Arthrobacter mobilis]NKX53125.1 branched-chain amino acid ABC transporter ATP-binding protein/permease [Arthrobacter mobilis]
MRPDKKHVALWAAFAVLVCSVPFILPKYWVFLFTTMAVSTLVARSVGVVTNQAGLLSICQMSFAAVGGWVVAGINDLGWQMGFPLMVLAGGLVALPLGLVIGLPALRVRGVELGVVTLGFAVALDLYLRRGSFPGTGEGKPVIPDAPFANSIWFYFLAWAVVGLLCVLLWWARHRPLGLAWAAVRTSERAAAALGVDVARAKISAFGTAAFMAGTAGGLMAGQFGLLTTDVFTPVSSMVYFAVAITTGAGVLSGALLAGALITLVPELLRRLGLPLDLGDLIFAAGAIDTLRRGQGGISDQIAARMAGRKYADKQRSCAMAPELPDLTFWQKPDTAADVLTVDGLTVTYGQNKALDNVSLSIGRQQVHALVGPNGAGKSTFVDAVTGFLASYRGSVKVNGSTVDRLSAHRRVTSGIRRTFQQSRVIDSLTIGDYIRLAGGREHSRESGPALKEFFGLPPLDTPVSLLDVGSRRILEIAAALAARPALLLLDEPAAGLDESDSIGLARRIAAIPKVFGASVLLIEHDMHLVRSAASAVTVLDFGQVIATGQVDEVLADERVISAYLGKEVSEL